jgi:hypothetical protein
MKGSFTLLPFDLRGKRIGRAIGPRTVTDTMENRYISEESRLLGCGAV